MTKRDPVPTHANREELARFWDTHSVADYASELKPTRVKFAKTLSSGITVRFDSKTLEKLRQIGEEKGIGPTTLIRMWINEKLHSMHFA